MDYITTAKAAEKWDITANRITILAKEGRIPGAIRVGYRWMIPAGALKPLDGRSKKEKTLPEDLSFRYPAYERQDENSIYPPLSDEELQLKHALEAFYACRIEEARRLLDDLPDKAANRYVRINALRIACFISMAVEGKRFTDLYGKLTKELQEDFPMKKEMLELKHELDATLGENNYFSNEFLVEPGYEYHESFLPHLGALCCLSLFLSNKKGLSAELLGPYEVNCKVFDQTANYVDSQTMHLYLGGTYALLGMKNESRMHFRRALKLAEDHELYYGIATEYYYMHDAFEDVLDEFSEDFKKRIKTCSENIHKQYLKFMDSMSKNSIFTLLLNDEYKYILYAVQGYSSKELSEILQMSERTIRHKYSEIYDILGVKNKIELVELYRKSV